MNVSWCWRESQSERVGVNWEYLGSWAIRRSILTDHHLQGIGRLDLGAEMNLLQAILLVERGDCVSHHGGGMRVGVTD